MFKGHDLSSTVIEKTWSENQENCTKVNDANKTKYTRSNNHEFKIHKYTCNIYIRTKLFWLQWKCSLLRNQVSIKLQWIPLGNETHMPVNIHLRIILFGLSALFKQRLSIKQSTITSFDRMYDRIVHLRICNELKKSIKKNKKKEMNSTNEFFLIELICHNYRSISIITKICNRNILFWCTFTNI